jgi:hypothetical protein
MKAQKTGLGDEDPSADAGTQADRMALPIMQGAFAPREPIHVFPIGMNEQLYFFALTFPMPSAL